jgi:hypothetical protein
MGLFRCDCGTSHTTRLDGVKDGKTLSCGCLNRELSGLRVAAFNTAHGHARKGQETATYRSWAAMLRRCYNPNSQKYAYYGGRGVEVCDRWKSFENFLADMGGRP